MSALPGYDEWKLATPEQDEGAPAQEICGACGGPEDEHGRRERAVCLNRLNGPRQRHILMSVEEYLTLCAAREAARTLAKQEQIRAAINTAMRFAVDGVRR